MKIRLTVHNGEDIMQVLRDIRERLDDAHGAGYEASPGEGELGYILIEPWGKE